MKGHPCGTWVYIHELGCPNCSKNISVAQFRDSDIPQDRDVRPQLSRCPHCGGAVDIDRDIEAEYQAVQVNPDTGERLDGGASE